MKINLLPGIPDDDNRDYLPEYLKDSEIVVNENGNNSQVYPKRLEEKKGALVDEFVDTWYQYVPESYNPEKKTPVVFSMHGQYIHRGHILQTEKDSSVFSQMHSFADSGQSNARINYIRNCRLQMKREFI